MSAAEPQTVDDPVVRELTSQILRRIEADTNGSAAAVLDDEALALGQRLWEAVGGGERLVPVETVAVLGTLHWLRYLRLPQDTDSTDLETALLFYGRISVIHPEVVPRRISALIEATEAAQRNLAAMMNRATDLLARAKDSDDIVLADTAVDIIRRVRLSVPQGHTARVHVQALLAVALSFRAKLTSRPADIHAAVDAARGAIPPKEADADSYRMARSNLGAALIARYELTGELRDLTEAVELARTVVGESIEADPSIGMFLSNLSGRLIDLYKVTGEPALLEEATQAGRRAVVQSSGSAPSGSLSALGNLAGALKARFELFGRRADLDEAIEVVGRAVQVCPPGHPDHRAHMANHVDLLTTRAGPGDLDAAVATGRVLLDITPAGHPARPQAAANVGLALRTRHSQTGQTSDLHDGTALEREALEAVEPGLSRWAALSANMARAVTERFAVHGEPSDLDEACRFAQAAVAATPRADPSRARRMQVLADLLEIRSAAGLDAGTDVADALRLWDESSQVAASAVRTRVRSAVRGGLWAMKEIGDPEQARGCYTRAVELLDRLAWRGLERSDQERALAEWSGVTTDAVAVALACGSAETGVQLAEQGRAVLWSQLVDGRSGWAELRERAPELVDRLSRISAELG
ncbi:tetratricopeptide repeat protein [Streptomyces luteogriseus]|uniref:tetratricopeptide repeat protein n=1 Tax=Streptomyces luteogriseus TaxID=68233 RepID=UPI0037894D59